MSRERIINTIETELERLNQRIDLRIIRGRGYSKEARRHRFLLAQLQHLRRVAAITPSRFMPISRMIATKRRQISWLGRVSTFVAGFTL